MAQRKNGLPTPSVPAFAAITLTLVLASASAFAEEPESPPTPEASPAPAEPAPAEPAPGRDESRDLWADSGFGFSVTTLGTERFQGRFYEVGAFGGLGGPLAVPGLQSAVGLSGVHVFENRGYVTKFTVGMLTALAVGLAGDKEHVGSKTEQYGGYTIRTDYYRTLTPDELAARQALPSKAFDDDYAVDLHVYAPRMLSSGVLADRSAASGFELYIGRPVLPEGSLPLIFQWGVCASYVSVKDATFLAGQGPSGTVGENANAEHRESFHYANAGVMVRLTVPVTAFAEVRAQWDINALQIFTSNNRERLNGEGKYYTSPFRLGAVINLSDRFYGGVTGTLNGLSLQALGGTAEVGFRL